MTSQTSEATGMECATCGRAPLPEGGDPFQFAINHVAASGHTVKITRIDVIRPEGDQA